MGNKKIDVVLPICTDDFLFLIECTGDFEVWSEVSLIVA